MSEGMNPLLAIMLGANNFVGGAEVVENEIRQLPDQLAFGPGDAAVLAAANTALERDFGVVYAIDPEEHAEEFPDWEERMLNSFVLCEHFSRNDAQVSIGWFNRLKLLRIPKYRYKEARRWVKNGFPEEIPEWVNKVYTKYTDQLADMAPDRVPKSVKCPNCKSRQVQMIVVRTVTYEARAGVVQQEGKDHYVSLEDPDQTSTHTVNLVCQDCNTVGAIPDDSEWDIPGLTNS